MMQAALESSPEPMQPTEPYLLVLSLIAGGDEWQSWSLSQIGDLIGVAEATRLEQIQIGLHDTALVAIAQAGLLAHPAKLMEMSVEDLTMLKRGERLLGHHLLSRYQLYDQAGLEAGQELIKQLGIAAKCGAFEADLANRIALAKLADTTLKGTKAAQLEAAQWAVEQARTYAEFADYLRYYLCFNKHGAFPAARAVAAEQVIASLRTTVFALLQCPVVRRSDIDDVLAELRKALKAGTRLAFQTPASAYRILAMHAGVIGRNGALLDQAVARFMARLAEMVNAVQPSRVSGSQDGRHTLLTMESNGLLTLALDREGCVVISDYQQEETTE